MTTFNRLCTFILAGLLLAGGILLVAAVVYLPGPYMVTAFDGEQFSFSPLSDGDKLMTAIGGLMLLLVGIFALALEVLGPPSRQQLPVPGVTRARVTVARQSVEARLVAVLERLPGVVEAAPRLRSDRKRSAVDVSLVVHAGVAVAALSEQAQTIIEQTMVGEIGLPIGPVRLRIRHAPLAGGEPVGAPAFGGPRD